MKNLIIILFILLFGCAYQNNCLDRAIDLSQQNPGSLIKYGINFNNIPHAEAVFVKDGIEYPLDGNDTIVKVIPQNQFLKYYTWQEAQRKWRSH